MGTTKVCPNTSPAAGISPNIEFSKGGQVSNMESALLVTSQDKSQDRSVTVLAPVDSTAPPGVTA